MSYTMHTITVIMLLFIVPMGVLVFERAEGTILRLAVVAGIIAIALMICI